jgi:hypothetical protein
MDDVIELSLAALLSLVHDEAIQSVDGCQPIKATGKRSVVAAVADVIVDRQMVSVRRDFLLLVSYPTACSAVLEVSESLGYQS